MPKVKFGKENFPLRDKYYFKKQLRNYHLPPKYPINRNITNYIDDCASFLINPKMAGMAIKSLRCKGKIISSCGQSPTYYPEFAKF